MAQLDLELCYHVAFLAVLLPLGSGACVDLNLGVGSGTIPDSDITASTEQSARSPATNGRLNYTSGSSWCAETSDTNPYLQIDLKSLHIICAVSTQGNSQADQWVKNYTLQISTDETTWTDYKEGGHVKFLRGNDNRNSEVKHVVYGVLTRFLRFLPQTHQGGVCMRLEVFGVEKASTCDSEDIGLASGGTIPDSSFSASSYYDHRSKPSFGRLNGTNRGWEPETKTNLADFLQIDLLYEYVICAVATQGANGISEWTTNYKIQLSMDGITAVTYQETNVDKIFPGNSNQNGIVKNSLREFSSAKFIRFQPTTYHIWKALRVEVYGVLLTKVPLQPPAAFNLTANSSTSITASWQLPPIFTRPGRHVTGFKLFYKKKDFGGCFSFLNITSGSTLSRLVTGLEKYTEYIFQVLAYTSKGDGLKSSVEVERAMEDAPSRPPSNFYVTATSSTTVTASWQLPPVDSRNGIIKGFKVFYERKDSSGSGIILTINGGSTFKKNVIGLHKYKEYEFKVLAFTFVGDGPYTSVVVQRTNEDVPSQPPGGFTLTATSSTSITASWQLPPEDSRNGDITGYKLFYKKRGISGPASMQPINDQATRTQEVTGLDKFTEYEFQILAFTAVGDGPNSTAIFKETKEAAPSGPPSLFNVTVNSSTSIRASWHLPREDFRHGIIRGYKLFYKKKGSGLATSLTTDNGNTSKIVTNLDKYTEYEFQVLAFTSVGNGPNTSSVFTRTMEDAPSAPTSLSFVVVPPSNLHGPRITLSWSKPAEPNGVIRSYTLFYSRDGGAPKEDSGLDKDALSHTVDVLGGVTYQFHVRAVTIKPGPNGTITVTTREYSKPFIKGLPKTTTTAIGELVLLKCEFVEETNASLTWTKDGLASIPRAQLENNGKILIIKDVVPGDSGVYECKAINMFGESRTATTVIVAVPPRIIEELSPSTVICQKQSPCFLSCQATSYIPFNYSWTKDGQLPTGDNIKLMNNSLIVSPQVGEDYGEYVCHVTNTFGSTLYEITLLDCEDTQSIFLASVIPLSCIVFVLLLIICGLIWQRRRAVLNKRLQCKEEIDFDGVKSSPDQQSSNEQASGSSTYMELKPMPSNQESRVPSEYQSLQENPENPGYYNTVLHKQNGGKQNEGVYEEI
ncbi:tyrosine-protein phosphatase Lar-like [Stylophora pistillata]|uniref:tyrosine-protein phosphatase Lar-like n=1 Tax=Stylophora pistillata TaxID=50429 RepID=UPI000C048FF0|nr:tyrosine-protein phosphatase Lar-like [Stylophora pistillata]